MPSKKKSTFFAIFDHVTKRCAAFFETLTFHPNIVFNQEKVFKVLTKHWFCHDVNTIKT